LKRINPRKNLKVLKFDRDVTIEGLPLDSMKELLRIWQSTCHQFNVKVPSLKNLNQNSLQPFAINLMLLERCDEGDDFHYLHHGQSMALNFGRNMTGYNISDLPVATRDYYRSLLSDLQLTMAPIYNQAEAATMIAVDYWDRLVLPLSDDGIRLEHVLLLNIAGRLRSSPDDYIRLAQNLNHLKQGLCVVNGQAEVTIWNRAWLDIFRVNISDLANRMSMADFSSAMTVSLIWPMEPSATVTGSRLSLVGDIPVISSVTNEQKLIGGRYIEVIATRLPDGGVVTTVNDISLRVEAQKELEHIKKELEETVSIRTIELQKSVKELEKQAGVQHKLEVYLASEKSRLEVTLSAIVDGVIATDEKGRIEMLNPAAEQMLGWRLQEIEYQPVATIFKLVHETSGRKLPDKVAKCIATRKEINGNRQSVLISRTGEEISIDEQISPIIGGDGQCSGVVIIFRDITVLRREERNIAHLASHDILTGLLNRRAWTEAVQKSIDRYNRYQWSFAVVFIDLDKFKIVNDTEGHGSGDDFLIMIARAMISNLRRGDYAGRIGGDEFVLLFENCDEAIALAIAEQVRQRIADCQLTGKSKTYEGSASLGVSLSTGGKVTLEQMMSQADAASYHAKKSGGNQVCLYGNIKAKIADNDS
jgi:diguanylate cyclase (GGDEF)-like protein/PAS domain S-box-containing protein